MAKDPAFLFYYDRFLSGTFTMTNEQVGKYVRLMCIQANKGYVTTVDLNQIGDNDSVIVGKFSESEPGKFINKVLHETLLERKAYTDSRRKNRSKVDNSSVCVYIMINHMNNHMKIGSSNNPQRRLLEIKSDLDNDGLEILWYSKPTLQSNETMLQKKFKSKCIKNEWFELNLDDLKQVTEILETDFLNDMYTHMFPHMINHMNKHMVNVNKDVNINTELDGGPGEDSPGLSDQGFFLDSLPKDYPLSTADIENTVQFISIIAKKSLSPPEVISYWEAFKIQQFGKHEWKNSRADLISHFRDSLKFQLKTTNGTFKQNHPHKPVITGTATGSGAL